MAKKRSYGRGLAFVKAGFEACWTNANDLVRSGEILLNGDLHAPALSLSVLALEEMGKLFLIDGLLFANGVGDKSDIFQQGLRRHNIKLEAMTMISSLAVRVARTDPRFETDETFKVKLRIGHENWKCCGQNVLDIAGETDFQFLDGWKQKGFYVGVSNRNQLEPPMATIDRDVTDVVFRFAQISKINLDFALGNGNIQRYFDIAQSIRSKFSEEQHKILEEKAEILFSNQQI